MTKITLSDAPTADADLRALKTFEGLTVWLPQLARAYARSGVFALDGLNFKDCVIEGPAVLMVCEGVNFQSCAFGTSSDSRNLLLRPVGEKLTGVIPFFNTRFEGCQFIRVGFVGSEDFIQDISTGLKTAQGTN